MAGRPVSHFISPHKSSILAKNNHSIICPGHPWPSSASSHRLCDHYGKYHRPDDPSCFSLCCPDLPRTRTQGNVACPALPCRAEDERKTQMSPRKCPSSIPRPMLPRPIFLSSCLISQKIHRRTAHQRHICRFLLLLFSRRYLVRPSSRLRTPRPL